MHIALQTTLRLVAELRGANALKKELEGGLDVVIVGGNDFYSQRAKVRIRPHKCSHTFSDLHIILYV